MCVANNIRRVTDLTGPWPNCFVVVYAHLLGKGYFFTANGETIPTWKRKIQTPPNIIDIGQIIIVEIYEPMKTLDRNLIRNKALLFEKITI